MGKHGALLSGSFTIQFFERVMWQESDLDVFVEKGVDPSNFERYLCEKGGYHFTHQHSGDDEGVYEVLYDMLEVKTSQNFVHPVTSTQSSSNKINIGPHAGETEGRFDRSPNTDLRNTRTATPCNLERILYHSIRQRHILEQGLFVLSPIKLLPPHDLSP